MIRVLQYRSSGGGYLQLTFLNTIGGIDSVLISQTQADVKPSAHFFSLDLLTHCCTWSLCQVLCRVCSAFAPCAVKSRTSQVQDQSSPVPCSQLRCLAQCKCVLFFSCGNLCSGAFPLISSSDMLDKGLMLKPAHLGCTVALGITQLRTQLPQHACDESAAHTT